MAFILDDDSVLNDVDAVVEQVVEQSRFTPRTFSDVLNQWTDTLLAANKAAATTEQITLIMKLGTLGQRLLFEANAIGQHEMLLLAKERRLDR